MTLRRPGIRRLVAAFGAVEGADYVLATVAAVALLRDSGALAVGLVGFRFAPAAVAVLFTAQLADRHRRERVLTATSLARAVVTAAVALVFGAGGPVAIVVGLVWLDTIVGSAYRPAQAAVLPSLARSPLELTSAVSLVSNAKSSSQALGALAGGVLVSTVPTWTAALAATALHLAAAAATAGVHGGRARPRAVDHGIDRARRLRAGMVRLRADPEAARIVAFLGLRALTRGLWLALAVVASVRLFDLGESGFGLLMAASGVGSLLAIGVSGLLPGRRRLGPWFAGGMLLCGLPVAAAAVLGTGVPAIALMVPWGLGLALSDVGGVALLNRVVPAADIAPVTGTLEAVKFLTEGVGALLAPVLVAVVGVRTGAIVAGLLVVVAVLADPRAFRRIDARAVGRTELLDLARGVPWFGPLALDTLEGVVARLQPATVPAGTAVIEEGDPDGDAWYLVEAGELEVEIAGHQVDHLARGDSFGELALLRATPRMATVRTRTDAALLRLDRAGFLGAVAGPEIDDARVGDEPHGDGTPRDLLAAVPLLRLCGATALDALAARATEHDVPAGTAIVEAGEAGDAFHVLVSGRAEIHRDGRMRRALEAGDAFGEIAALHGIPRTATVVATEPTRVLSVPGDALRAAVPQQAALRRS